MRSWISDAWWSIRFWIAGQGAAGKVLVVTLSALLATILLLCLVILSLASSATALPWEKPETMTIRVDDDVVRKDGRISGYKVSLRVKAGERKVPISTCNDMMKVMAGGVKVGVCYQADVIGRNRCLVDAIEVPCSSANLEGGK